MDNNQTVEVLTLVSLKLEDMINEHHLANDGRNSSVKTGILIRNLRNLINKHHDNKLFFNNHVTRSLVISSWISIVKATVQTPDYYTGDARFTERLKFNYEKEKITEETDLVGYCETLVNSIRHECYGPVIFAMFLNLMEHFGYKISMLLSLFIDIRFPKAFATWIIFNNPDDTLLDNTLVVPDSIIVNYFQGSNSRELDHLHQYVYDKLTNVVD